MTQICILCAGSRGDINPCLALGKGLKERGHDVRVATHAEWKHACERLGLQHASIIGNVADSSIRTGPYASGFDILAATRKIAAEQLQSSWQAVQGAGILIFGSGAIGAAHFAERLGIPAFRLCLQPDVPNRQVRPSFLPAPFTYRMIEQMQWQSVRSAVNAWRKQENLPPLSFFGAKCHVPTLVAFSPTLIPRPSDWDTSVHMTGFLRLPADPQWQPPEHLKRFLQAGKPPVYVGLGSFGPRCAEKVYRGISGTLRKSRVRCVLQGFPDEVSSENVCVVDNIPHDWLFPRMSALIHHGGVGTLAEGLYAGKPTLVIPHLADQYFWGHRVHAWGLGPRSLPVDKFTAKLFEERFHDLIGNCSYKRHTASLLPKLVAEPDGITAAVHLITT